MSNEGPPLPLPTVKNQKPSGKDLVDIFWIYRQKIFRPKKFSVGVPCTVNIAEKKYIYITHTPLPLLDR